MKIQQMSIIILVVSMMVLGTTYYISDLGYNHGTTADFSGLNETLNQSTKMINQSNILRDAIYDIQIESPGDAILVPYKLIKAGWASVRLMFTSWVVLEAMGEDLVTFPSDNEIPIPEWIMPSVVAMLLITLAAIFVYAFFKWRFED